MKPAVRILFMLLTLALAGAWQPPAFAGRLATISGQAENQQVVEDQQFKLSEQAQVEVGYTINAIGQGCNVQVRIFRQLPNGTWSPVNTPVRTGESGRGSQTILLPAGDYKVQVTARNASFTVTVDK